mmetsp:Transcript_51858/g.105570  ORF Transcript_51858/g.105570 Transcript_51858/m.105570 type:complete len:89 (+) Transcript_51858:929-1195(+)
MLTSTSYMRTSVLHDETSRRLCSGANWIAEMPSLGGSANSDWLALMFRYSAGIRKELATLQYHGSSFASRNNDTEVLAAQGHRGDLVG